jgi:hypothetical protein
LKNNKMIVPQALWLSQWWLGYLRWPLYENFVCLFQDAAIWDDANGTHQVELRKEIALLNARVTTSGWVSSFLCSSLLSAVLCIVVLSRCLLLLWAITYPYSHLRQYLSYTEVYCDILVL